MSPMTDTISASELKQTHDLAKGVNDVLEHY